jgi:hypothetical protein
MKKLFLIYYLVLNMAVRMYNNVRPQLGMPQFHPQQPPSSSQPNVLGNAFNAAGSGLIRGGLGAYGEKIFGSGSEYVQSNVCITIHHSITFDGSV